MIHFAGLKSVSESIKDPLSYYQNNVTGTLVLLEEMRAAGVNSFIFSSSATVYGNPDRVPLNENSRTGGTTNPYGTSKYMVEQILEDFRELSLNSVLPVCVTSTQSGRIRQDVLVKIPMGSRTIWSLILLR